jgi:hypothetical protein
METTTYGIAVYGVMNFGIPVRERQTVAMRFTITGAVLDNDRMPS